MAGKEEGETPPYYPVTTAADLLDIHDEPHEGGPVESGAVILDLDWARFMARVKQVLGGELVADNTDTEK